MLSAQTKDKMFSIIGHDLRGPIGNIRNILEIILEDFDTYSSEEIKDFLKPVKDTAKSAHNLLSNLLYWARSQSGMIVQSREEFWINESVHENITLPASDTENKNISIFFDDSHDFLVYADENMVNTVLRNLISNAVKFTFPGGKITIQIKQSEKNNLPFVEISIRDTGKGIEEENLCKLFNNREHYTTFGTNNEKGSGLGLILCKEFIELMGGEIFVESEVLKGSNFIFTLPVYKH
jgi:signal transduction histidine kinase